MIFISLLFYRSYENRPIFGLWSYPFFAVIIIFFFLFLLNFLIVIKKSAKSSSRELNSAYFNVAIFIIGISYFVSTIDNPQSGARLIELNLFGSTSPISLILEWCALILLSIGATKLGFIHFGFKYKNLFLVICSLYMCLLIGEGIIRIKALVIPNPQGFPTYTSSIWSQRYVQQNQAGFRDTEHFKEKERQTKRLLVVGDSVAFGWGIKKTSNRFGEQLANKLTKLTSFEWESINASAGDTHTLQHIAFLKNSLVYQPDIIILLYVFNDIDYLKSVTNRATYRKLQSRFRPAGILYKNSYLFQEVFLYVRLLKLQFKNPADTDSPYNDEVLLTLHVKDIVKFVKLATSSDAIVIVVPFDYNPINRNIYNNFVAAAKNFDIPVIPIMNNFKKYSVPELRVNKFDGHPNELAHSLAAEAILGEIINRFSLLN